MIYKVISINLTRRLSKVIGEVIDNNQSSFVPRRVIQHNILMAHELLRGYGRKHISPRCSIQIDILKAYDTVEWSLLEAIL